MVAAGNGGERQGIACVRGERFSDGHWAVMLSSGKVVALLKRLRELRDQFT